MSSASPAVRVDDPSRSAPSRLHALLRRRETWVLALLLLTVTAVGAWKPSFLDPANLLDILADAAPAVIIACAMTLVVVTGEIDISVGSLLGLSAAVMGLLCYGTDPSLPVPAAVGVAVLLALGVGMLNGLLVTLGRVPSIIVTLGMLTVLRGVTKLVMAGENIYGRPEALRRLATGTALGLPLSVWVAAAVVAVTTLLARRTPLGLRIYAVGSNAKAATLAGVHVGFTKFVVFALSGLCTGIAAVLADHLFRRHRPEGADL